MDALRSLDTRSKPLLAAARATDNDRKQADTVAAERAAETQALGATVRRNAETARVEEDLNRQLAATQAANLARVVPPSDAAPPIDPAVSAVATAPSPILPDTRSDRERDASNGEQRRVERQQEGERAQENERSRERHNAEARAAQASPAGNAQAVGRYQANQSLLEDARPAARVATRA
ncbi:hypothetical protein [Crenobacter cavernae]|uniref:Uncharacterized protein n=1 Tax=Crenobacter cavernae TaxID=2290923 RepID=A0A345Y7W5_9NEIS|nr:hypothetical protein [Crenobacter cavernae]AXK40017.1 hypothetical protein DWG20_11510 [Crenobacter cavernae]